MFRLIEYIDNCPAVRLTFIQHCTDGLGCSLMSTQLTEFELFQQFLSNSPGNGNRPQTVDEAVKAFRAYQHELQQFREQILPALHRSHDDQSSPFDVAKLQSLADKALAEHGISD
jgi:hypothetical protein